MVGVEWDNFINIVWYFLNSKASFPRSYKWRCQIEIGNIVEEQFSKDYFRCSYRKCSVKEVFLKVLQNSQASTCVGLSFYIRNIENNQHTGFFHFLWLVHFPGICIDCSCHLSFLFLFFFIFSFLFFCIFFLFFCFFHLGSVKKYQ